MTASLTDLLAEPTSGRRRAVVLDSHDYAQTVFLQGKPVPWQEPMAYANFFGQVQGVLKSDLALLSLDRFYAERVTDDPALQAAMGAKSRTGYALRTLLSDAETTMLVIELATVFIQTQRVPVVLQIPSPMQWLARTHPFSGSADVSGLDADSAENASMYVADWLRGFAALPVIAVLLDDRGPALGAESPPLSTYSPIANVTDHYRWALGQRHDDRVDLHASALRGAVIGTDFWSNDTDTDALPVGDFLVGEVPREAVPERVLNCISKLV